MAQKRFDVKFPLGSRIQTKAKPVIEAIVTGITIRAGRNMVYECGWNKDDETCSSWFQEVEIEAVPESPQKMGF